jgi:hypothetical protein
MDSAYGLAAQDLPETRMEVPSDIKMPCKIVKTASNTSK